jgi:ABC-type Fe3+ transport system substrate-binding protein
MLTAVLAILALVMSAPIGAIQAEDQEELSVVTSYPPSFFEPFRKAFEAENPGIRTTIIQRNTASASRFILEKRGTSADIFWASSPDSFELLKQKGELSKIADRPTGAPEKVFGYPVNDPEGYYLGFALSGYGIVYNASYLAQNKLPVPKNWQDLLNPVYSGHIGITSPSRSGTTHLIIEALLQTYGWEKGWAMLSQLGGNLSTVTARSFGVAAGVAQRRFGIGITIDFLAKAPDFAGGDNTFVLPPDSVYVPASIAILSRARNKKAADLFVDFLLSPKGQALLLDPAIGRIPLAAHLPTTAGTGGENEGLFKSKAFDPRLSAERYGLINLIFDDYIVRRRATLARLWKRLAQLEALDNQPDRASTLARARRLLGTPPLSAREAETLDQSLKAALPRGMARSPQQMQMARDLRNTIEHNLAMVENLLVTASPPRDDIGFNRYPR